MLVKKLSFNKDVRVFFVGDIHARYTLLVQELKAIGFSPENGDILVSVGDIIDAGGENDETLLLLDEPWFHVTEGNHENLMKKAIKKLTEKNFNYVSSFLVDRAGMQKIYDLVDGIATDEVEMEIRDALTNDELNWIANGGAWFYDVFDQKGYNYRQRQANALMAADLPLAIEVSHPLGLVGVVHAGLKSNNWSLVGSVARFRPAQLMWMRDHINAFESGKKNAYEAGFVKGVDALVVGHSIPEQKLPLVLANTMYLDVGAKSGSAPFIIELSELLKATLKSKND